MRYLQSLCAQLRQTACDIHLYLGHSQLEEVCENALAHRDQVSLAVSRGPPREQIHFPFVRSLCVLCVLCGLIDE